MSQFDPGNLSSPLPGSTFIDDKFEPWRDAVHSNHSGSSRPSYAVAGMDWIDTSGTPWVWYLFDGNDDIPIGTFNATTNLFTPTVMGAIWCGTSGGTANAQTLTPSRAIASYTTGTPAFECLISAPNTAAGPTIAISGLAAKTVKIFVSGGKVNAPIGCLQGVCRFIYDGTDLILINVRPYNKATAIATGSTVNLDSANGDYVHLTGTTTVNAFTLAEGREVTCVADGAFTITDGTGGSPQVTICPGAANITTAAGDVFKIRGEDGGTTRIVSYTKANGAAVYVAPIPDDSITLAKLASTTANRLFGTDGTGDPGLITAGSNISISGGSISATGGLSSVSQGNINTATGTFSATGSATGSYVRASSEVLLPGGSYGFDMQVRNASNGAGEVYGFVNGTTSASSYSSYARLLYYKPSAGGDASMQGQQRYITASAPWDYGDGEAAGFVFAKIEKASGKIVATWAAQDPPWGYNGPTQVFPDYIDDAGKKFRLRDEQADIAAILRGEAIVQEREAFDKKLKKKIAKMWPDEAKKLGDLQALEDAMNRASAKQKAAAKQRWRDEALRWDAAFSDLNKKQSAAILVAEYEEITQAIKNADMDVIPHPFTADANHVIVMLDPMDQRLRSLLNMQSRSNGAFDVTQLLRDGTIYADNEELKKRKGPSLKRHGVMQVGLKVR